MKRFTTVFVAILMLMILVACGGGGDTQPQQGGSTSTPSTSQSPSGGQATTPGEKRGPEGQEYGGVMKIATGASLQDPFGVPWMYQSFNRPFVPFAEALLLETYWGDYFPFLAKDWIVDLDKPEIIFVLEEGIKFSDGSPFDAEAVAWNVEKWMEGSIADSAIKGAEVRGEYEVAILLHDWSNSLISIFASRISVMVSKESYEKLGEEASAQNAVGTGPFTLTSRVPGATVTFSRRDGYWREGEPYLDGIEYYAMSDVMTQNAAMLSTGDDSVDWLQTSRGEQIEFLRDNADVYIEFLPGGATGLNVSSRNEGSPFAKKEVRQALSYAIDREAIVAARGFGVWTEAAQLVPEGYQGHLPDSYNLTYDPAKAKELLAQAGYPNGLTADFYGTTSDRDAVVAIQSMLDQVGIHTNLEFPEAGAISTLRYDGFEGITTQGFGVYPNILQLWWYYFDAAYMYYPTVWRPQAMMDLYVEARKDPEVDTKKAEDLHKMVLDDMVAVPIYNTYTAHILRNNMHGTGHPNWGLGTQWLAHSAWKSSN